MNKQGHKMNQEIATRPTGPDMSVIEQVVMQGDLSKLNAEQRVLYYNKVCESVGLNPLTNPFAYIQMQGKLTLYAKKDCTEQLRKIHGVSIEGLDDKLVDDVYIVTARAKDKHGRTDESKGAVVIGNLKGEAKANAIMKCETKAKRRVTLSICGMGWTDESEIDSIPNAKPVDIDLTTGEIKGQIELAPQAKAAPKPVEKVTPAQIEELKLILDDCEEHYSKWFYGSVKVSYGDFSGMPADRYEHHKKTAMENRAKYQAQLVAEEAGHLAVAEVR